MTARSTVHQPQYYSISIHILFMTKLYTLAGYWSLCIKSCSAMEKAVKCGY